MCILFGVYATNMLYESRLKKDDVSFEFPSDISSDSKGRFKGYVLEDMDSLKVKVILAKEVYSSSEYVKVKVLLQEFSMRTEITPIFVHVMNGGGKVRERIFSRSYPLKGPKVEIEVDACFPKGKYIIQIGYFLRKDYFSNPIPAFICSDFVIEIK